jgi:hypothetical protein
MPFCLLIAAMLKLFTVTHAAAADEPVFPDIQSPLHQIPSPVELLRTHDGEIDAPPKVGIFEALILELNEGGILRDVPATQLLIGSPK